VFSNRIVGYSISDRMKSRIAVDALANAVARRAAQGSDVAGSVFDTPIEYGTIMTTPTTQAA
jgi:putative transposase